jgi:hypothetical protein
VTSLAILLAGWLALGIASLITMEYIRRGAMFPPAWWERAACVGLGPFVLVAVALRLGRRRLRKRARGSRGMP